jgi:ketosteroid isomerase-like protein
METQQVIALEKRLIEAMKTSNMQELNSLVSDDLIFTAHNGMMFTKQDDLDAHSSGNVTIFEISTSEYHIKIEGNVAIVSVLMEISGSFFGNTEVGFFRFMRVWKSHPQGWQVIAAQSTQVVS